ncbi:MAG: UDP-N-acetylmuramoyl-tripeptide--D-alanyl-D-alanine ligase [Xanthomonadales bacterium]|nr:UDP-N-acetylmuramoyl-tripeptide--D-alanyl-D-alanine ligase [Xanthomonadales bacterium]
MDLQRAAELLGVPCADAECRFEGVCTDSRKVEPGMLFAALPGERVDGHDFISRAVEAGAVAVLASREVSAGVPVLVVDDVLRALGQLAAGWRAECAPAVVGITGSNGKTTVKEMVASVLRRRGQVLATQGNYNNELGVPLTLFGLAPEHDFAVLEMGAAKAGDIAYLAGIAQPRVGVITNVGPAHLEGFGDQAGVARAKGEMYQALPADGTAVINADQPWAAGWQERCSAGRVIRFALSADAQVRGAMLEHKARIETPDGRFEVALVLPGEHNLSNALAATAVALALDVPLDDIRAGLEDVRPVPGRLNLLAADGGWQVIDDTYNANPASLYAALQVLTRQPGEAWLALGDMKELGPDARKLHAEMGDAARALGVRRLYATGEMSKHTVDAFGGGARHFEDREALVTALKDALRPGVTCLVKGSRSMGMEHVVRAIVNGDGLREAV